MAVRLLWSLVPVFAPRPPGPFILGVLRFPAAGPAARVSGRRAKPPVSPGPGFGSREGQRAPGARGSAPRTGAAQGGSAAPPVHTPAHAFAYRISDLLQGPVSWSNRRTSPAVIPARAPHRADLCRNASAALIPCKGGILRSRKPESGSGLDGRRPGQGGRRRNSLTGGSLPVPLCCIDCVQRGFCSTGAGSGVGPVQGGRRPPAWGGAEGVEFAANRPCESARSRASKGVGAPLQGGLRWGDRGRNTLFGLSACGGYRRAG